MSLVDQHVRYQTVSRTISDSYGGNYKLEERVPQQDGPLVSSQVKPETGIKLVQVKDAKGNVVSETTEKVTLSPTGMHAPIIDLDIPVELYESSTPGHYHLYLGVNMSWPTYKRLLRVLASSGVIKKDGWYKRTMASKMSFLRAPGIFKQSVAVKK